MKLHENEQLFADAINAASRPVTEGGLGIKSIFIEKDYWICRSLKMMAEGDKDGKAVFKGGTSLSKAYGIGARFSEDIDVAIAKAWTLSGNQLKNLIRRTAKNMTVNLGEIVIPGVTSKGSHYHKAFYAYPRAVATEQVGVIKAGQILVEINSFANPYPSQKCTLSSFLTDFIIKSGNESLIEQYEMQPFEVTVLDKRRTLTEKLVSLLRCSLADNPIPELSAKIRHFYDLHFLLHDTETHTYLQSEDFKADLKALFDHDQQEFEKPDGWQGKTMSDSPLLTDFHTVWKDLQSLYLRELPDLAYQEIPSAEEIEDSIITILSTI
ncbi:MAG: nucleotidyl transferase AbiEii/AbiGii toxin family protein [Prevotella sp.]|nr:nucleotidyl transferase AbiEii/AbiGii toxin family protein [Prevotella sp.]